MRAFDHGAACPQLFPKEVAKKRKGFKNLGFHPKVLNQVLLLLLESWTTIEWRWRWWERLKEVSKLKVINWSKIWRFTSTLQHHGKSPWNGLFSTKSYWMLIFGRKFLKILRNGLVPLVGGKEMGNQYYISLIFFFPPVLYVTCLSKNTWTNAWYAILFFSTLFCNQSFRCIFVCFSYLHEGGNLFTVEFDWFYCFYSHILHFLYIILWCKLICGLLVGF